MIKVIIKTGVIDSIYIDLLVGSGKWFSEEGVVLLSVCGMGSIEVF